MKYARLLGMLPLAAILVLGACAPKEAPSDSGQNKDLSTSDVPSSHGEAIDPRGIIKEKTEITYWNTFSYSTEIENIIEKFKEIEPNVTVTNDKKSGGYDDLKEMTINGFPANNYPDLIVAYPDHVAEYIQANKVVDVEPYAKNKDYGWSEDDWDDVLPAFIEEGRNYTLPGMYSLPVAKSSEAMFYNEEIIGIDLSSYDAAINDGKPVSHAYLNNLTWDELFDHLCPALIQYNTAKGGVLYKTNEEHHGLVGYDSDDNLFITLAQQYGYGYTDVDQTTGQGKILFDNPGMKGLMKTFNKAYKNGYFITKGTSNNNYINTFFTKRNCLFSIGSTGGVKYQVSKDFNVGVARIPHAAGRDPYVINQGPSVAILDHGDADRILATWLFYRFLTNQENALYWSMATGYMPIRKSCYETDDYRTYSDPTGTDDHSPERLYAYNARYVATIADDLFASAVFVGSSAARKQAGNLMTRCLMEAELTDEFLNDIFAQAVNDTKLKMD